MTEMTDMLQAFLDDAGIRAWIALALLLVGASLSLAAAIGIVRFPDPLVRLHAMSKPQVLGLACCLAAVVVAVWTWTALWVVLPAMVFQLALVPVSTHMIARAGLRSGDYRHEELLVDDTEG
ncbi:sodium:proton antiporter [Curtobacterium sp. MCJR17_055]|jgi:multicomponent Na+:H+ antiporter subunit G|uniref:monovalent cation/H(+) antiporter subunit G n=1 Tax=unclassified Curtobacterium TaxID=257496 RepID=UPI000D9F0D55|nr:MULTISPECIES: monovalent cation/H(+) antiporter subunit G [unclassified Curtobacterium]PYY38070.1 sodium:proton antiporter [Curtobacterium sp. MCBD17_029]PYY57095.1 sodium:proton antiporter [Curtobacterium sp. MCJR17_055]PYY61989.1 sodium:proton antiporter [Curtobacterium sp. MCPF17_015]PZE94045.1 sodium:proton antiporter [Curtobacterium sp. MCBD17_008]WIB36220.1 monovalent cation/H(+) antiporter subunit G [Curtobacterium sp. MCJR17_043]